MQGSTVSAEIADAGSSYIFSGALQPMRVMAFFSTARVVSASFSRASSTGFSSPLMRQAAVEFVERRRQSGEVAVDVAGIVVPCRQQHHLTIGGDLLDEGLAPSRRSGG